MMNWVNSRPYFLTWESTLHSQQRHYAGTLRVWAPFSSVSEQFASWQRHLKELVHKAQGKGKKESWKKEVNLYKVSVKLRNIYQVMTIQHQKGWLSLNKTGKDVNRCLCATLERSLLSPNTDSPWVFPMKTNSCVCVCVCATSKIKKYFY